MWVWNGGWPHKGLKWYGLVMTVTNLDFAHFVQNPNFCLAKHQKFQKFVTVTVSPLSPFCDPFPPILNLFRTGFPNESQAHLPMAY